MGIVPNTSAEAAAVAATKKEEAESEAMLCLHRGAKEVIKFTPAF